MVNLWAYIDPATTAIIWQVLAGVFITLGVVFGIWWAKITTFIKSVWVKIFGKKKTEDASGETDDELNDEVSGTAEEVQKQADGTAEEVQKQADGTAEEVQKQADGTAEEVQKQADGTAEEVQKQADGTVQNGGEDEEEEL